MKDEIKDILDEIEDYSKHEYLPPCCELTNEDCKQLLDYITNLQEDLKYQEEMEEEYNKKHTKLMQDYFKLQEENKRLKENAIHNDKVVDKAKWNEMLYKSRNEKAINILKDLKYIDKYKFTWDREFNKALSILQGEDKDE